MLQAADVQKAHAQGNVELTGVDRRRVEANSGEAMVKHADIEQEVTKIAGSVA